MALMMVILQVEAAFPREMDCVKMAMELVVFDAHMDVQKNSKRGFKDEI